MPPAERPNVRSANTWALSAAAGKVRVRDEAVRLKLVVVVVVVFLALGLAACRPAPPAGPGGSAPPEPQPVQAEPPAQTPLSSGEGAGREQPAGDAYRLPPGFPAERLEVEALAKSGARGDGFRLGSFDSVLYLAWHDRSLLVTGRFGELEGVFRWRGPEAGAAQLEPVAVRTGPGSFSQVAVVPGWSGLIVHRYHEREVWAYPQSEAPVLVGEAGRFSPSPDGRWLLLFGFDGSTTQVPVGVWKPAVARPELPAYEFPYLGLGVRWAPDGRHLLAVEDPSHHPWFKVVAADGSVRHTVRREEAGVLPTWSPDGRNVAYLVIPLDELHLDDEAVFPYPAGSELRVLDVETGREVSYEPRGRRVLGLPVWAADSARLFVAVGTWSPRSVPPGFYRAVAEPHELVALGASGRAVSLGEAAAGWLPASISAGGRLLLTREAADASGCSRPAALFDPEKGRLVPLEGVWPHTATWAGETLVVLAEPPGAAPCQDARLLAVDGPGEVVEIPLPGRLSSPPVISPDGRWAAVDARLDDEGHTVFVVRLPGR